MYKKYIFVVSFSTIWYSNLSSSTILYLIFELSLFRYISNYIIYNDVSRLCIYEVEITTYLLTMFDKGIVQTVALYVYTLYMHVCDFIV